MTLLERSDAPAAAPRPPADPVSRRLRLAGEVLVTLGLVVVLFGVYEIWVTNWISQGAQTQASQELTRRWAGEAAAAGPGLGADAPGTAGAGAPGAGGADGTGSGDGADAGRGVGSDVAPGEPLMRLSLPSLGSGHSWTVIQGTDQDALAKGPGHYLGTALAGQVGNLAIAGHRVGRGAPFDDIDGLRSCDAIVTETAQGWAVYRVLPFADEADDWASGRGRSPQCSGLVPLDPKVPGREIVAPSDIGVTEPVPNRPGIAPVVPVITLTSCHPRFSAKQRIVFHGVFDRFVPKIPGGGLPSELAAPGAL